MGVGATCCFEQLGRKVEAMRSKGGQAIGQHARGFEHLLARTILLWRWPREHEIFQLVAAHRIDADDFGHVRDEASTIAQAGRLHDDVNGRGQL